MDIYTCFVPRVFNPQAWRTMLLHSAAASVAQIWHAILVRVTPVHALYRLHGIGRKKGTNE